MRLINRYLFMQFSQLVAAVLTVLFLISIGGFLTDLIAEISRGKVPAGLMLQLLALRMPRFLSFVMPLALFIGLMMGIARLYADIEMAVLASIGIGSQQLWKPVLWVAAPIILVIALSSLWIVPATAKIAKTMVEQANRSFGIDLALLKEARNAALSLKRGTLGKNLMYFETGQGSALSANAHHGIDQQTCETRAYAVARHFNPFLVNTVVGFIGPEYLYNGKQIIRAGLEDHFCGKLLGVPMGCDICYTNHAEADQDDMDTLLTLLGVAGINFIMGIPGSDDIMLNYQTTSFHDALYARQTLGLKPAPEFEQWLAKMGIFTQADGKVLFGNSLPPAFRQALAQLG